MIEKPGRCSARSPPIRGWCWRISRSTKNPTKSLPCKSCCRNSAWLVISPPPTRSTVKKTFEAATLADAHLIVQLKDNQPTLCQKVEALCVAAEPSSSVKTVDRNRRNRHETRTITVFDATAAVAGTEWEPHVAAIIQVERDVNVRQADTGFWKPSLETSIYLSNWPVAAKIAADAIRKHWGIENKSHYTRDVTFREDASRIRTNPGSVEQPWNAAHASGISSRAFESTVLESDSK